MYSFTAFMKMFLHQVNDLEMLNEKLKQYMGSYNETIRGAAMDLVFFKDAMVHLVKVVYICTETSEI